MILKKIAGIAFAIAFLMALRLFGEFGSQYISKSVAKTIFMCAGAIGLLLNLLSFQHGKHSSIFNLLYWAGSIILFVGLSFFLFKLPYGFNIIVIGLITVCASFILPNSLLESNKKQSDLLDDND